MRSIQNALLEIGRGAPNENFKTVLLTRIRYHSIHVLVTKSVTNDHQPHTTCRKHISERLKIPIEQWQSGDPSSLIRSNHQHSPAVSRSPIERAVQFDHVEVTSCPIVSWMSVRIDLELW